MSGGLDAFWQFVSAVAGTFITAAAGVAMRYSHQVQRGKKVKWSRIWMDAPTVFIMGLAGGSVGDWLTGTYSVPSTFGYIIAAGLGYLGPSVVDRFAAWIERRDPKDDD